MIGAFILLKNKGCEIKMPCTEFTVNNPKDIIINLLAFLTDETKMGTGKAWQLKTPSNPNAFESECVLMGVGDGTDEIYVGIQLREHKDEDQTDIRFNGFAGYDDGLKWNEQPGCIYFPALPIIPLPNRANMPCWVSANSYRFILVVQLSTQYESAYIGFMKPVAVERQYPYPLVIGGSAWDGVNWNTTGNAHSIWVNPYTSGTNSQFMLRRSDGTWELANNSKDEQTTSTLAIWPQNTSPTNVLTVLDNSLTIENIVMFPELLYECGAGPNRKSIGSDPIGIIGQLDGVYFVGNREDISSKDTLIHNGKPYIVFNNINRRENDQYFCIEWF
jgi:hypothetical protein